MPELSEPYLGIADAQHSGDVIIEGYRAAALIGHCGQW